MHLSDMMFGANSAWQLCYSMQSEDGILSYTCQLANCLLSMAKALEETGSSIWSSTRRAIRLALYFSDLSTYFSLRRNGKCW